jgi:hypothetical protein
MEQEDKNRLNRLHDDIYGPPGKPEVSFVVQMVGIVKEVKHLRIASDAARVTSDAMRSEVTGNTRTNKNLIKLMWLVVGLIVTTIGGILANG